MAHGIRPMIALRKLTTGQSYMPIRLRLLFVVWMASWFVHVPLPVIHQHDGHVSGAAWSAKLGGHLAKFHTSGEEGTWIAWHVHWVQRSELADCEPPTEDHLAGPPADDDVLITGQSSLAVVASIALRSAEREWSAVLPLSELVSPHRPNEFRHPQFHSFGSSAPPLRALYCVARC